MRRNSVTCILILIIVIIFILNIMILALKNNRIYSQKLTVYNNYKIDGIEPYIDELNMNNSSNKIILDVKNIQQLPELPSGCEITSATIVLNYYDYKVDKMEMLNYLPMDSLSDGIAVTPYEAFVGNPKSNSYGCYSPVITNAINDYFEYINEDDRIAKDISGSNPEELYEYVNNGIPVIVWATLTMKHPYIKYSWTLPDGSTFYWKSNEHCLVLIGYTNDTVIFSDPHDPRGIVEYSKEVFETIYNEMYKQAVIIDLK